MSFLDVARENRVIASADGLDEVAEVSFITPTAKLRQDVAILVVGHAAGIARADDVALGAVEDVADASAFVFLGRQAADFKDQLGIAIIENADLRVRGFAVIDVAEPAAEADYGVRQRILVQAPAGFVH